MERLNRYVGRQINLENIKNAEQLSTFGFECRYLPDPPEDFDEFEFATVIRDLDDVGLMVTIQSMAIIKMFFAAIDRENPDVARGLSEEQLAHVFHEADERISGFLEYITTPSPKT